MVEMTREEFEDAVGDALDLIPDELAALIDNVVVLVEDEPPDGRAGPPRPVRGRRRSPSGTTGGLGRLAAGPHHDLPQLRPCACARTRTRCVDEVAVTVVHEIAHHFGIDDDRLHELGWG